MVSRKGAPMRIRKRPFLLLEVLISFVIVVACILPMIYPHVMMYKSKKQFVDSIHNDHIVNLLYVDILEKLQRNEIAWQDIENGKQLSLEKPGMQASYRFEEKHKTPDASGFSVALLDLTIVFSNKEYKYKIFAGRRGYAQTSDDDLP